MRRLLVGDVLTTQAERTPRHVMASLGSDARTFGETDELSRHLALVLAGKGIRRGDHICWVGPTSLDAIPLSFALAHLGVVFVPLNPNQSAEERGQILDQVEPALTVAVREGDGDVTFEELAGSRAPSVVDVQEPEEDDPFVMFFTSGTTGRPKGVPLSHRLQRLRAGNGTWSNGPVVCMFPQFHMAGWTFTLPAWLSGDEVAYIERPTAEDILDTVDRRRASRLYAIPAVWRRILEAGPQRWDLSSLRMADTGTSATPPELLAAIHHALPTTTTEVIYGSTEAGSICALGPTEIADHPNSVGRPRPGVSVRIDDNDEIWVRGPWVFDGYFRNEEATAAALVDGWYRTGERGERDEDGFYRIIGRAKDVIRTGGESVAPAEVDHVLLSHPAVADVAVAGVPDADWGEIVTAFVVAHPGATVSLEDLRAHCDGRLSTFKHPRRLVIVSEIPRTGATSQVRRRELVDRMDIAAMHITASSEPAQG